MTTETDVIDDHFLTIGEAAAILRISRNAAYDATGRRSPAGSPSLGVLETEDQSLSKI